MNVEMSSGRPESMLTFWLNKFYPESNFDGDVFQTWAPTHAPRPDLTIKRSDFERVVHTGDVRQFVSEIERLQGKDGLYYAGSYCVYGEKVQLKVVLDHNRQGRSASTCFRQAW